LAAWLVCLTLAAPAALAQSRVTVPDGCGSEDEYHNELQRLTGASASDAGAASVSIEPLVEGGYELRLTLGDEQRTLRDPDCRVLWRSAIVIVAAASRSRAEIAPPAAPPAAAEPPAPAPPPPSPAPPSQVTTPPAPSAPARTLPPATTQLQRARETRPRSARRTRRSRGAVAARPRERSSASVARTRSASELDAPLDPVLARSGPSWGLAVGAGVSGGVVPGLGPALELGAHLEALPWATALSFRYWPERSESVGERGVDVSAFGGRAALSFRIAPALNALAGLELMRRLERERRVFQGGTKTRPGSSRRRWALT
jgi:hypothetical protein